MSEQKKKVCSFCGRSVMDTHMIEGLDGLICAECVELCMDILEEGGYRSSRGKGAS